MNGLLPQALQQPVLFVPIGGCCRQVALCIWKKNKNKKLEKILFVADWDFSHAIN